MPLRASNNAGTCAAILVMSPVILFTPALLSLPVDTMVILSTLLKLLTNMADVVRAMAEPLSKVDKITIVSTGNDSSAGVNKITGDMTQNAAQVPAQFK